VEGKVAQTLAIEEPELFSLWKSNPYDFRILEEKAIKT